ncbi:MAG TPA: DNA sulfur modification protein DndB [Candidatus Sulfotelmatobacter sp.]|nr:DNA sulfur modification protein DndB [Candidatus Sulfotelmatobacter sp.]
MDTQFRKFNLDEEGTMSPATLDINTQIPCVQGMFGERLLTYTTQIKPKHIPHVLGHDPRGKNWKRLPDDLYSIYKKIQRSTSPGRRDSLTAYLEQRLVSRNMIAAFPAISIGLTEPTEFKPFSEDPAVGVLLVHDRGVRMVLDGLGRITACLDLREESPQGAELVDSIVFPVTFYVPPPGTPPLSVTDLGQLFVDFNFRVHRVPANVNLALDQADIYVSLANELSKESFIKDFGGMEVRAASLGKKSTALVVQSVLVRAVRGATEGRDFQESNLASAQNPNLTDATFKSELHSIVEFFIEIQTRMGEKWGARKDLHLSAPGWQALGVIRHDMTHRGLELTPSERTQIYDTIAGMNWSRSNRDWADKAHLGVWAKPKNADTEQVVILGAGRNNTQAIIDFLRVETGLQKQLEELRPAQSVIQNHPVVQNHTSTSGPL